MPRYNEPPTASEMDRESEAEARIEEKMNILWDVCKKIRHPENLSEVFAFLKQISEGVYSRFEDPHDEIKKDVQAILVHLEHGDDFDGDGI